LGSKDVEAKTEAKIIEFVGKYISVWDILKDTKPQTHKTTLRIHIYKSRRNHNILFKSMSMVHNHASQ
jgi:hypothetical protein